MQKKNKGASNILLDQKLLDFLFFRCKVKARLGQIYRTLWNKRPFSKYKFINLLVMGIRLECLDNMKILCSILLISKSMISLASAENNTFSRITDLLWSGISLTLFSYFVHVCVYINNVRSMGRKRLKLRTVLVSKLADLERLKLFICIWIIQYSDKRIIIIPCACFF